MHIHILGICGTFMAGVALLARAAGHRVSGSDAQVYPPMSTQLTEQGIPVTEGYEALPLDPAPDLFVIGNALSRGNPAVEQVLARGLPYTSGPEWLGETLLRGRWVLAVAGTHGKTTTAAMLAHVLEQAGLEPGFLIGGVPRDFGVSARLGTGACFVVEADEYDTAFFDKRSKFVHYRPRTLILNNLEYDHADIFSDLAAIQLQFHHLLRTVPGNGRIVAPARAAALDEVLAMGCWTPVERFASAADANVSWSAHPEVADGSRFAVLHDGAAAGEVEWSHTGAHNVANGLAAIAAADHAGVAPADAAAALCHFGGVKRRLEIAGRVNGITVYDDFAHHPTAIETTLAGLRARVGPQRIVAVLEPRSNTMRMGHHATSLAPSLAAADRVALYQPGDLAWDLDAVAHALPDAAVYDSVDAIIEAVAGDARAGDHVVIMSNGGFGGIHTRLLEALGASGAGREARS